MDLNLPRLHGVEACRQIVRKDAAWFPPVDGGSLYLRPFMFANETFLGVRSSKEYIFCVVASAVAVVAAVHLALSRRHRLGAAITPARATEISFFIWIHSSLFPRSGGIVFLGSPRPVLGETLGLVYRIFMLCQ